ncbi:hypothetical protein B0T10DRAFT_500369 [Thelonectria olida]|uniref:Uncharacterized protein n=1 Tax=Thelonectria olida TaxID=1576542 RepID=A0A9P8VPV3_9HYPO|nr:hypothetical protein B0T10DRAFT_500369 [Thelonectria olida]
MLIPANDLPCPDKPCQTYPGELNSLIHQCDQLENDLLEAQASRNELGALASRYAEQLDEEVVNRGIVELALNQNKEALKEKIKELEEAFRLIGERIKSLRPKTSSLCMHGRTIRTWSLLVESSSRSRRCPFRRLSWEKWRAAQCLRLMESTWIRRES